MTPHDLYLEAIKLGLRLEVEGDKLAVCPLSKCPPDFLARLREHKTALLRWLSDPPCPGWGAIPPNTLELVIDRPRPSPEDRERMIGFLLQQAGGRPGPLLSWLLRRESTYYDGPGRKWDCSLHAYAAARDAACWQLNRNEQEVLDLLRTTKAVVNPF